MSRLTIAALAGVFLCASAEGASYAPVAGGHIYVAEFSDFGRVHKFIRH